VVIPVQRNLKTATEARQGAVGKVTPAVSSAVRSVTILGATGSVGTSTLDLISRHPGRFEVVAVTGNSHPEALADAAIAHNAKFAVVGDEQHYTALKSRLAGTGIEVAAGAGAMLDAASRPADCVMAAIMGAAGLAPTMAAVAQGRRVALANKECLVSAGALFMDAVHRNGTELLPVDSEHSAIFQSIGDSDPASIERLILTASGGPFRTWPDAQLAAATPEQALRHPNWTMGQKITIDSATMMNKGLELIEAFHLFPVRADQIDVVIHPQSIIHSLVEFIDGSTMAQLSNPDMRTPIALSLGWPARIAAPTKRLNLVELATLTFEAPDPERFPAIEMARSALQRGGGATAALNAANEIAVARFLDRRCGFLEIARLVSNVLDRMEQQGALADAGDIAGVLAIDARARLLALEQVGQH
jgi:1-deoxy-D-xylulose-5-phosphate reductoisomerase